VGLRSANAQDSPFAKLRGKPNLREPDPDDIAGAEQFLRDHSETIYQPVGSCRMGSDSASVADLALRVRGVDRLRVVDASIMPTLVGGNTNAPTYLLAEQAADMMRRQT